MFENCSQTSDWQASADDPLALAQWLTIDPEKDGAPALDWDGSHRSSVGLRADTNSKCSYIVRNGRGERDAFRSL